MNGVAKTGVPGLGILVVPLMLFVIVDPRISPGVVLPLLCLADLGSTDFPVDSFPFSG
jgi:uncharacterized protein